MASLVEHAPAKVNLTLPCSAVAPTDITSSTAWWCSRMGDRVTFAPGDELTLVLRGETATARRPRQPRAQGGARACERRIPLKLGPFMLDKRLPVAAGLGGGSADAAAALRLIAGANRITRDDTRCSRRRATVRTCRCASIPARG